MNKQEEITFDEFCKQILGVELSNYQKLFINNFEGIMRTHSLELRIECNSVGKAKELFSNLKNKIQKVKPKDL